MRPRERRSDEVLRGVWNGAGRPMLRLRRRESTHEQILRRVRKFADRRGDEPEVWVPRDLHSQAPRRKDPHVKECVGRRAQAGDRPLRRRQGLYGVARRPGPRGSAHAARSRARTHTFPSTRTPRSPDLWSAAIRAGSSRRPWSAAFIIATAGWRRKLRPGVCPPRGTRRSAGQYGPPGSSSALRLKLHTVHGSARWVSLGTKARCS